MGIHLRTLAAAAIMMSAGLATVPAMAAIRFVAPGDSLQRAIDEVVPGDTIVLQAGATYTGSYILRNKTGTGWITIESSLAAALPGSLERILPSHAPSMPKLVSSTTGAVFTTAAGAHHYRFVGLEITAVSGRYVTDLIRLGSATETSTSQLPNHFELDRLYIHGDRNVGAKRGITLNSANTTIKNSWISDIKSTTQESQAICGWNGTGPYRIENNYLEASGVNVMFGGALPSIANVMPSDIVLRGNHIYKPLSWKQGDPAFAGTVWMVKNLFELKFARRLTVEGNVFENNWVQAQSGYAILFTVKVGADMPWGAIEDVVVRNNILRNSPHGFNISGRDATGGSMTRVTIANNVIDKVPGRFLQVTNSANNLTVDHNTIANSPGSTVLAFGTTANQGLVLKNNIASRPIRGDSKADGTASLNAYAPGAVVSRNVISGAAATAYPAGNYYPASISAVRFVDEFGGNYTLAADSPYRGLATDGKDIGADIAAVTAATAGAVTPR